MIVTVTKILEMGQIMEGLVCLAQELDHYSFLKLWESMEDFKEGNEVIRFYITVATEGVSIGVAGKQSHGRQETKLDVTAVNCSNTAI